MVEGWLGARDGMAGLSPIQVAFYTEPPAHLAELDLHEDMVLPPTAPLRTPGVLGPVGTGAAGRGAPRAHEAASCPGRGTGNKLTRRDTLPVRAGPSARGRKPFLASAPGVGVGDKEGERTEATESRTRLKIISC